MINWSQLKSSDHNEHQDGEGVRGKLIFAVFSLTRLLGAEQLQQKGEVMTYDGQTCSVNSTLASLLIRPCHFQVFSHLRHITDLCNSLPEEAGAGHPLQLKDSTSSQRQNAPGNCDKTLATCDADTEDNQERRSSGVYDFTPGSKQKPEQRKGSLGRVPSMACDVSSYFEEQQFW